MGGWPRLFPPRGLLPRGLLQPTFQPFSGTITELLELLTPVTGPSHQVLTDAGASLGKIIKIAQVADEDVKRDNTIQFLGVKEPVSFPVVNKVLRHDSKSQKTTFKYKRPNFSAV